MPVKSKAQLRGLYAQKNKGDMSGAQVKEWVDATPNIHNLPEKVEKKAAAKKFSAGLMTALDTNKNKMPKHDFRNLNTDKLDFFTGFEHWGGGMSRTASAKFTDGFMKVAGPILAEQALNEARANMQDAVPGNSLKSTAETGQRRGRATRTESVLNEDRVMDKRFKRYYDTSRGGIMNGYDTLPAIRGS